MEMAFIPETVGDISLDWLNQVLPSTSQISKFELNKVSEDGEGYLSTVTGASIYRESGSVEEIVIKLQPLSGTYAVEVEKLGSLSEREITFYNVIVPLIPINLPIPKCYYANKTNSSYTIITKNLKSHGYQISNLEEGLTIDQISNALTALGKFHAGSIAIRDKLDNYPIFDTKHIDAAFEPDVYYALNKIKTMTDDQKHKNLESIILKHLSDSKTRKQFVYHGLQHGDFWCNNILIRPDGETRIIDFQISNIGPLPVDIAVLFLTSTTYKFWKANQYKLLEKYHTSFVNTLKELGIPSDEFTFDTLKSEYESTIFDGLTVTVASIECFVGKGPKMESRITDLIDEFGSR